MSIDITFNHIFWGAIYFVFFVVLFLTFAFTIVDRIKQWNTDVISGTFFIYLLVIFLTFIFLLWDTNFDLFSHEFKNKIIYYSGFFWSYSIITLISAFTSQLIINFIFNIFGFLFQKD